jgi:hypothetical protein
MISIQRTDCGKTTAFCHAVHFPAGNILIEVIRIYNKLLISVIPGVSTSVTSESFLIIAISSIRVSGFRVHLAYSVVSKGLFQAAALSALGIADYTAMYTGITLLSLTGLGLYLCADRLEEKLSGWNSPSR